MARPRKKQPALTSQERAMTRLRSSDAGTKADLVVVFRLKSTSDGLQVVDAEYMHWLPSTETDPPEGMFECVAKWIRQRFFAAWGEDVGTRAVQVAVNKGLEMLIGTKSGE